MMILRFISLCIMILNTLNTLNTFKPHFKHKGIFLSKFEL